MIIILPPYNASTSFQSKQLKLPSIQGMLWQETTIGMVYKSISDKAPVYLSVLFNIVITMTRRTLHYAKVDLRSLTVNTTLGRKYFPYKGALFWNSLATEIKVNLEIKKAI